MLLEAKRFIGMHAVNLPDDILRGHQAPGGAPDSRDALTPVVSAVMPCLNEARTLAICIEKAQRAFASMDVVGEVVVADNGSSDGSIEIASSLGAVVVNQPVRGYGAALIKGISAARGDFIVMADADDSYDWEGMAPLIQRLEDGVDLVVGNRFQGGIAQGAMPPLHRYLGNPVLSWLARQVHGAPLRDFHCGMRAFRRDAIAQMKLRTPGMEFATEMIVNAQKAGLRISEVPITLQKDGRDRPPHLRSFRDGWRHLRFILTYGPNYLYLLPGGILFLLGLVLATFLAAGPVSVAGHYFGIHFLALGCMLTLLGFNIVTLGLFSKMITAMQSTSFESRTARWISGVFRLEIGLAVGTVLSLAGLAVFVALLFAWIRSNAGPMESTIHLAFFAGLVVVLGVNIGFSSFLLHMMVAERTAVGKDR